MARIADLTIALRFTIQYNRDKEKELMFPLIQYMAEEVPSMPIASATLPAEATLRFIAFLLLWFVLFECVHVLIMLLRHGPLIGWAISPLGVTMMYLQEPSSVYIWFNVLLPALVSGFFLYFALFSSIRLLSFPRTLPVEIVVIALGVIVSSAVDLFNALRDVCYPLWGEARILQSIQSLHASWASIHFTPFGLSYLRDRFNSSPTELLQAL
jgi:hypothetical protein